MSYICNNCEKKFSRKATKVVWYGGPAELCLNCALAFRAGADMAFSAVESLTEKARAKFDKEWKK